jgi:hypothetical protein
VKWPFSGFSSIDPYNTHNYRCDCDNQFSVGVFLDLSKALTL